MTLNELLTALAGNDNLLIEVVETVEEADSTIIEFEVPGYEALSTDLLARTVESVTIKTQTTVFMGITIKVV